MKHKITKNIIPYDEENIDHKELLNKFNFRLISYGNANTGFFNIISDITDKCHKIIKLYR